VRRRDALLSFAGVLALGAGASEAQDLSADAVRRMMQILAGLEPMPGEESSVLSFLLSFRSSFPAEPEVEPASTFDP
jgi:hypothetical protein